MNIHVAALLHSNHAGGSDIGKGISFCSSIKETEVMNFLANIINPYEGDILETLFAPVRGIIFFIHNVPLTYANTAVKKLLGERDTF